MSNFGPSTRQKRLRKLKNYALISYENEFEIFQTKNLQDHRQISIGKCVKVNWPDKGLVMGTVAGLSKSPIHLLTAKEQGHMTYYSESDDDPDPNIDLDPYTDIDPCQTLMIDGPPKKLPKISHVIGSCGQKRAHILTNQNPHSSTNQNSANIEDSGFQWTYVQIPKSVEGNHGYDPISSSSDSSINFCQSSFATDVKSIPKILPAPSKTINLAGQGQILQAAPTNTNGTMISLLQEMRQSLSILVPIMQNLDKNLHNVVQLLQQNIENPTFESHVVPENRVISAESHVIPENDGEIPVGNLPTGGSSIRICESDDDVKLSDLSTGCPYRFQGNPQTQGTPQDIRESSPSKWTPKNVKFINKLNHIETESYLTNEKIDSLMTVAKSRYHFATLLVLEIFDAQDLDNATISGVNGFRKLDSVKIDWVSKITFKKYPIQPDERRGPYAEWAKCRNIIDTKLRKINKMKK